MVDWLTEDDEFDFEDEGILVRLEDLLRGENSSDLYEFPDEEDHPYGS